jgi:putative ribosome biogenesis GTPase RsgA
MTMTDESVEPRDCPYMGLDYFQEKFGAWFFGRDADGDKIITNLQAARLTLLHAESGVGKSSLLRAGVAWRLRQTRAQTVTARRRI